MKISFALFIPLFCFGLASCGQATSSSVAPSEFHFATLQDGSLSLNSYTGSSSSVSIPAAVEGKSVSTIGAGAFANNFRLENVSLPSSLKSIGDFAFKNCSHLVSLILPASLTSYGIGVTAACTSLTGFSLASSNTAFFSDGLGLYNQDATTLYDFADGLATSTTYTIAATATAIAPYAFFGCTRLNTLNLPSSLKTLGASCFAQMNRLTSLTLPEGISLLPESALAFDSRLNKLTLPSSLKSIAPLALSACQALKSLSLPEGLTSLGDLCFSGMLTLDNLNLPDSLTSLGEEVFLNDAKLKTITLSSTNSHFSFDGFGLYDKEQTTLITFCQGSGTAYNAPVSLKKVRHHAFYNATLLSSLTLNEGLLNLEESSLSLLLALTSLSLPKSLTSLGDNLLYGDKLLASLNYGGTQAKFKGIAKGRAYFEGTLLSEVSCNDGTIAL